MMDDGEAGASSLDLHEQENDGSTTMKGAGEQPQEQPPEKVLERQASKASYDELLTSKQMAVHGTPAATTTRKSTGTNSKQGAPTLKRSQSSADVIRRSGRAGGKNTSGTSNNEPVDLLDGVSKTKKGKVEVEQLRHALDHAQSQITHLCEEKQALEQAFRRLDQEISSGYNLAERKEKELRIAELLTKNQKMATMLEKELKQQEALRNANDDLQGQVRKLQEQLALVNSVLMTVDAQHTAVMEANATLSASYAHATDTIEQLQGQVHILHAKLMDSSQQRQQFTEYEAKIALWEKKANDLEHELQQRTAHYTGQQQQVELLKQQIGQLMDNKAALEAELTRAHDQLIHMSAAVRSLEARLEVSGQAMSEGLGHDKLKARIRSLENDLYDKTQVCAQLSERLNELMHAKHGMHDSSSLYGGGNSSKGQSAAARLKAMQGKINVLSDKLKSAEEFRERKTRCLEVLMQAFPLLLRELDAMQDKLGSASESNEILSSAVQQLSGNDVPQLEHASYNDPHGRLSAWLSLARDQFALALPYQPELLAGYAPSKAFAEHAGHSSVAARAPVAKPKTFPVFRVVPLLGMRRRSQREDGDSNNNNVGDDSSVLVVVPDPEDTNGATFLNRCKINSFLQLAQGKALQRKQKLMLITKISELLTKHRELLVNQSIETTTCKATMQLLQRQVDELQHKVHQQNAVLEQRMGEENGLEDGSKRGRAMATACRRKLLTKMIELLATKQQQQRQILRGSSHSTTFLTQSASDVLIHQPDLAVNPSQSLQNMETLSAGSEDSLNFSDCGVQDDDLGDVLLKMLVSGVCVHELRLDSNELADGGAMRLAEFLEKAPSSLKVVNLADNPAMTYHGVELLKQGLMRNPRIHRVQTDERNNHGTILEALTVGDDFVDTGHAAVVLRIVLPTFTSVTGLLAGGGSDEAVGALLADLRRRGIFTPQQASQVQSARGKKLMTSNKPDTQRSAGVKPRPQSGGLRRQSSVEQMARTPSVDALLRKAQHTARRAPSASINAAAMTGMRRARPASAPAMGTRQSAETNHTEIQRSFAQRLHETPYRSSLLPRIVHGRSHVGVVRGLRR